MRWDLFVVTDILCVMPDIFQEVTDLLPAMPELFSEVPELFSEVPDIFLMEENLRSFAEKTHKKLAVSVPLLKPS